MTETVPLRTGKHERKVDLRKVAEDAMREFEKGRALAAARP